MTTLTLAAQHSGRVHRLYRFLHSLFSPAASKRLQYYPTPNGSSASNLSSNRFRNAQFLVTRKRQSRHARFVQTKMVLLFPLFFFSNDYSRRLSDVIQATLRLVENNSGDVLSLGGGIRGIWAKVAQAYKGGRAAFLRHRLATFLTTHCK